MKSGRNRRSLIIGMIFLIGGLGITPVMMATLYFNNQTTGYEKEMFAILLGGALLFLGVFKYFANRLIDNALTRGDIYGAQAFDDTYKRIHRNVNMFMDLNILACVILTFLVLFINMEKVFPTVVRVTGVASMFGIIVIIINFIRWIRSSSNKSL